MTDSVPPGPSGFSPGWLPAPDPDPARTGPAWEQTGGSWWLRFAQTTQAVLTGPDTGRDRRFEPPGALQLEPCTPDSRQLLTARQALAAVPGGPFRLLYARVDLVSDARCRPVVLELELIEPQLYLAFAPSGAQRLAKAIAARARLERLGSREIA